MGGRNRRKHHSRLAGKGKRRQDLLCQQSSQAAKREREGALPHPSKGKRAAFQPRGSGLEPTGGQSLPPIGGKLTPLQPGEPQRLAPSWAPSRSPRPRPTSPGPRTCCAPSAEPAGTRGAAPRADLPPPRAGLPPARHFHTSGANRGRARRQATPRAGRAGEAAPPGRDPETRVRAPGEAGERACALGGGVDTRGRAGARLPVFRDTPSAPPCPPTPLVVLGATAAAPGTGGAAGHPEGLQHLQQGGEIPLGSLGTTLNAPRSGHPSSEPDTGQRPTPGP